MHLVDFFSNFVVSNQHSYLSLVLHNLYANLLKILEICKDFSKDLVNERGNLPRRGVVPRFSDLEVISLSLTAVNERPIGRVKYALS